MLLDNLKCLKGRLIKKISFLFRGCPKKVLHLTAQHSDKSVVSITTNNLISSLKFDKEIKERNLWTESLIPYNIEHVISKFRILEEKATEEDHLKFEPVQILAEELNDTDLLILSTPLWNMSLPYIMKQYIDIAIQPGKE